MPKFAKLIDLENGEQVLLTLNYNSEDDNYEIVLRTDLDVGVAEIKLGFDSEEKAKDVLEAYSLYKATKFRAQMEALIK